MPVGNELEELLQAATQDFVSDPRNVRVDHQRQQIILATIFKWYESDFTNDVRQRGLPVRRGAVDYLLVTAPRPLRDELGAADGYEVVFEDYDWSLNSQH